MPVLGKEAGSRKELLRVMPNSHCKKHQQVQQPNREVLSAQKLAQPLLEHSCSYSKMILMLQKLLPLSTPWTWEVSLLASFWGSFCAQELWESPSSQQAYFKPSLLCVGNAERQTQFPPVLAAVLATQSLFKPHREITYWICTQAEPVQVPDTWVCDLYKEHFLKKKYQGWHRGIAGGVGMKEKGRKLGPYNAARLQPPFAIKETLHRPIKWQKTSAVRLTIAW